MIKSWPTAVVLSVALVAIAATLIAGFLLEVDFQSLAVALGGEGGLGVLVLAAMRGLFHGPGGGGAGAGAAVLLIAIAAASSVTMTGCGASAMEIHAPVAQGAQAFQIQSEPVIRQLRLQAIERAIREVADGGGTREEAEAARARVEHDWQCPVDGHRLYGTLVSSYVEALWLASETGKEPPGADGDGELEVLDFLPFVQRLVDAYRAIAACANAFEPGQLPVPSFLDVIPPAWGVSRG